MKTPWVSPKPQLSPSPAMVPIYAPQEQREPPLSNDKYFALHGGILMLVLVGFFSIFLISLVLVHCLRRSRAPESGDDDDEDSTMQRSFCFFPLRKRRRIAT
ncbi:hypothetical protein NC652_002937 [Populus alba x Populus x berolinensis]|uniref:Uncharacterized protein n=4 Tax=Populus TaxID=3689 RepID=A0ACC4D2C9_POPAL|nr:hypothetical protein POTOM_062079 [Populus tomentosa]KAJ6964859.1 hypothetical protein NC652_002937 [Populus alba x Populus x berolinensis]KAJ7013179.1 hypothetical protein NC653_003022 [Populus alba x Populus x berolinensis]TKS07878.1 hypothetical protein D5086_0000109180 [Populus alba]